MSARRRRTRCDHRDQLIQVAYTQTGVGRFRTIDWCARCGALAFRDFAGGADGSSSVEWRRPTLITKRRAVHGASRSEP